MKIQKIQTPYLDEKENNAENSETSENSGHSGNSGNSENSDNLENSDSCFKVKRKQFGRFRKVLKLRITLQIKSKLGKKQKEKNKQSNVLCCLLGRQYIEFRELVN